MRRSCSMPRGDRDQRFALIALLAALVAIVLVAWFGQPSDGQAGQPSTAQIELAQQDEVGRLVAALREFNLWQDTFPQWLMAVFTAAATGVSLYAVRLVRDTLELNRKATEAAVAAATVARDALGAERAWFVVDAFDIADISMSNMFGRFIKEGMGITVQWKNVGRSPAAKVCIRVASQLVTESTTTAPTFSLEPPTAEDIGSGVIGPGGRCGAQMCVLDDAETAQFKAHTAQYLIHCKIWYYDVFKPDKLRQTEITFGCMYNGKVQSSDGIKHHISFTPVGLQNSIS